MSFYIYFSNGSSKNLLSHWQRIHLTWSKLRNINIYIHCLEVRGLTRNWTCRGDLLLGGGQCLSNLVWVAGVWVNIETAGSLGESRWFKGTLYYEGAADTDVESRHNTYGQALLQRTQVQKISTCNSCILRQLALKKNTKLLMHIQH